MKKEDILENLRDLGLTENESSVYIAMLSLGPTTVVKISIRTGVRRTTVYPTIESLKKKGLAKEVIDGFKTKYQAESPVRLERMLEIKKNELNTMIPDLMSMYNTQGDDSFIHYYEGLEAVKSVYEEQLESLRSGDFYYVISNLDKWMSLDEKFFTDYKEKLKIIGLESKILGADDPTGKKFVEFQQNYNQEAKLLPAGTVLESDVMITPHQVIIVQLNDPVTAIVIQNRNTIQMQKSMFMIIWSFIKGK